MTIILVAALVAFLVGAILSVIQKTYVLTCICAGLALYILHVGGVA